MIIWVLVGLAAAVVLGLLIAPLRRALVELDRLNAEDDGDYLA